jgi:tetratricopeptide (TPR) repeat protein
MPNKEESPDSGDREDAGVNPTPMKTAPEGAPAEEAVAEEEKPQPPTEAEIKEAAEAKKQEGNKKFKAGSYRAAIALYTEAFELRKDKAYLTNRASALMRLNKFADAAADCEAAVALDSKYSKAYQRGSGALCHLGRFEDAAALAGKGLAINPYDVNLGKERTKIKQLVRTLH